jgi:UMF1 family MFS transporter
VARSRFAYATSAAVAVVALLGPVLGVLADYYGRKKAFIAVFLAAGVFCTAGMYWIGTGEWQKALWLFVLGNVAVTSTLAFYNALLPHVARADEVDRVSTAGFALGYLGGGLLLLANLLVIRDPARFGLADQAAALRLSFLSAAVWWLGFSLPLFLGVREPAPRLEPQEAGHGPLRVTFDRLRHTFGEMRVHRDAALLLLAFLIYNDAINTIIRMATSFGSEIRIPESQLILAVLMVQFLGVPFSFLFGALARRFGPKRSIFVALGGYVLICFVGYSMRTAAHFFVLAALVSMVMGGAQALSRSLFATLIPQHKSGEMFGFFGVFDRFGGVFGSALFGFMLARTGSSRPAILALLAFFVVGGALLALVDVGRGRRSARAAEAEAQASARSA